MARSTHHVSVAMSVVAVLLLTRAVAASALLPTAPYVAICLVSLACLIASLIRPDAAIAAVVMLLPSLIGLGKIFVIPTPSLAAAALAGLMWADVLRTCRRTAHQPSLAGAWVWCGFGLTVCTLTSLFSSVGLAPPRDVLLGSFDAAYDSTNFAWTSATLICSGFAIASLIIRECPRPFVPALGWMLVQVWTIQLFLYSVLQRITGLPALFLERGASSPFEDIHALGAVAVTLLIIALFETARRRTVDTVVVTSLLLLVVAGTFSRTTWLLAGAAFSVFMACQVSLRSRLVLTTALVASLVVVNLLPPPTVKAGTYAWRVWNTVQLKGLYEGETLRRELWARGASMIAAEPVVGHGLGTFRPSAHLHSQAEEPLRSQREFAHNSFIQLAAEAGLPAVTFLICLIVLAGQSAWKARGGTRTAAFGLMGLVLTQLTSNSILIYPSNAYFFWILLGCCASMRRSTHVDLEASPKD